MRSQFMKCLLMCRGWVSGTITCAAVPRPYLCSPRATPIFCVKTASYARCRDWERVTKGCRPVRLAGAAVPRFAEKPMAVAGSRVAPILRCVVEFDLHRNQRRRSLKTFDIHRELGYEVSGPSTFLLNIEAASMPNQRVLHEALVTDPPLACDRYTDPIVKNRFVRFNADTGSLRVNYRATVEADGAPEGVPD